MKRKTVVAVVAFVIAAACRDSAGPSSVFALRAPTVNWTELIIIGSTFLAIGQTGNWQASAWPTPSGIIWTVGGSQIGSGTSASYSSSTSFTLYASATDGWGQLTHQGWHSVEVWQGCDPSVLWPDPMYCEAAIDGADSAGRDQECTWEVETNMPPDLTVVDWYVNDIWHHTGPSFQYAHHSYGSFTLHMASNTPNFGSRNDTKLITVSEGSSCDLF